jgi:tetratricopeptide (TPR) repeat protein
MGIANNEQMRWPRFSPAAIAAIAGMICLLAYLRTLGCDFVNIDDPDYVQNNMLIRHLDSTLFVSVYAAPYNGWWMPLTWISFALDYHFWGLNPRGYHLTNTLIHSLNTGLVVMIADIVFIQACKEEPESGVQEGTSIDFRLFSTRWYPLLLLFTGLLWGMHPLRVESVAWVTERKDVLNGLFTLSSILLYLKYVQHEAKGGRGKRAVYLLSLLMFALSLMAKSISVVLPVMLLILDWYPLGRFRRSRLLALLSEKIPFCLLSIIMAIITLRFSSQVGYLVPYSVFPFSQRLVVSGNALFEYCRLMICPSGIIPFYLIPDPIPLSYALKSAAFAVGAYYCFRARLRNPWLLAAMLLFILPLVPVLAFFQNGDQALAPRFTYLASLAPTIVAIGAIGILCLRLPGTRVGIWCGTAALLAVLACAAITQSGIRVWQDSISIWTRVIDVSPEVASYKERGLLYLNLGDYAAATKDFSSAISLASGVWQSKIYNLYAFRGEANRSMGHCADAVQDYTAAISIYPHPVYFYHRGMALQQLGQAAAAREDFLRSSGKTGPLEWFEMTER